jgi:glycoprotein endo-alpha-1,2-mannosidase
MSAQLLAASHESRDRRDRTDLQCASRGMRGEFGVDVVRSVGPWGSVVRLPRADPHTERGTSQLESVGQAPGRRSIMNGERNVIRDQPRMVYPFGPGIVRWSGDLALAIGAVMGRRTTPLRIRILTTSGWTSLQTAGDIVWNTAEILSSSGEQVHASIGPDGDYLHLNQPPENAEAGKVVELVAEVTYNNPSQLGNVLRGVGDALLARFTDPQVEFVITRGDMGWTHVQLINVLGDEPAVIANEWWHDIHGQAEESKSFSTPRSTIFNTVEPFYDDPVDASTLVGKVLFGYQGWFLCPGDGSDFNRWHHWMRDDPSAPIQLFIDMWPDMREYEPDERFPTGLLLPNGEPAEVFSSYNQETVARHFRWMKDYDLDGVFAQRFVTAIADDRMLMARNKVLQNVRLGAERHGRVFAVMYDISDGSDAAVTIINDWRFLTTYLGITDSPAYLHHNGKPVVAIWGAGSYSYPDPTAHAAALLIDWLKDEGTTVFGGTQTRWRMQGGDTSLDPDWAAVFRSYDIISPWSVHRYANEAELEEFRNQYLLDDIQEAAAVGAEYMPVIWPGFSWYNMHFGAPSTPLNEIPRDGGRFFNMQAQGLLNTPGVNMLYVAMFDEVDEGTAMFKLAEDASMVPAGQGIVTLDMDGYSLPSHRYLQLARALTQGLHDQQP